MTNIRRRLLPLLLAAAAAGVAGCGSDNGLPAVTGPAASSLDLTATEMRYTPAEIAVEGGDVPVVLRNEGLVIHDLRIEGQPTLLLEAAPGRTAEATWRLEEGRYRIYCSLPGHRAAGMEGVLEVR